MTTYASCCEEGKVLVEQLPSGWWLHTSDYYVRELISFCPFCGWDLSVPFPAQSLEELLAHIAGLDLNGRTVCFDVDGVLCDHRDQSIPYEERPPYPKAVAILQALKAAGCRLHIQTARYMQKHDGNQGKARDSGWMELRWWLDKHAIPYDEVYMGKASAHIYADDRGCRVESDKGIIDWTRNLLPLLQS